MVASVLIGLPASGAAGTSATPSEPSPPAPAAGVRAQLDEAIRLAGSDAPIEALQSAERAVLAAQQARDPVGEAMAGRLRSVALERLARTGEAVNSWHAAADAWRLAGDGPGQIEALVSAGVLLIPEDPLEAGRFFEAALMVGDSEDARPMAAARVLSDAGDRILSRAGPLDVSDRFYQSALRIQEERASDSPDLADTLHDFAHLLAEQGKFDEAEARYRKSLGIRERLGPDSPQVARSLHGLCSLEQRRGDLDAAAGYCRRAAELLDSAGPQQRQPLAHTLVSLGNLTARRWDLIAAESLLKRAVAILQEHATPVEALAGALNNLGVVAEQRGDLEAAERYYLRALSIDRQLSPDSLQTAVTLRNLGLVASARGDSVEAQTLLYQTLAIQQNLAPGSPYVAASLTTLGDLARERGDLSSASAHYRRALDMLTGLQFPSAAEANSLAGLGAIALAKGRIDNAREHYEGAMSVWESLVGPDHPEVARVLRELAALGAGAGRYREALEAALRAEEIGRDHLRLVIRGLPERQALLHASARVAGLDIALEIVAESPGVDDETATAVWDAVIRSRAVVLDEMARRNRTVDGDDGGEIARLRSRFGTSRERLARLVVRGPGDQGAESYRNLLDRARRQKEADERALALASASFRGELAHVRRGFDTVSGALASGECLVAFTRFERSSDPAGGGAYAAFVLRGGERAPAIVRLGSSRETDVLVLRLRRQMREVAMDPFRAGKRGERRYRKLAKELHRRIWRPVEPHLGTSDRVYVVPDGQLSLLNLAALTVGSRYLVEMGPTIVYLSTERELAPDGETRTGNGLLVLGDPDFEEAAPLDSRAAGRGGPVFRGPRPGCEDFLSLDFEALPATALEVEGIVDLWVERHRADAPSPAEGIDVLTGRAATERAFKRMAPGHRVLHLGTHGFFLGDDCGTIVDRILASDTRESPLLRSGLALAGANQRDDSGFDGEDGILTAEEIGALDLRGVELAVLSACDTGVGEYQQGEGVLGLRRAFRVAGAQTLIMSLWPVDDASSRRWMTAFYERFIGGLEITESARHASLQLLRERRDAGQSTHPFFWAGFVADGNPRRP